jgi:hypothetical protein
LASNAALTELHLVGYPADAARQVFARLVESCNAAAAIKQQQQQEQASVAPDVKLASAPSLSAALSVPATTVKMGCQLRVLRVTGPDYKVLNLLEDVNQQQQQQQLLLEKQQRQQVDQQQKQQQLKFSSKQPLQQLGQLKRWVTKRRHQESPEKGDLSWEGDCVPEAARGSRCGADL